MRPRMALISARIATTGPGLTAHRRYAISVNLSSDFDGGDVSFPEYRARGIKAPQGWAVVFPAAILHSVSKVTYGRRLRFLAVCL